MLHYDRIDVSEGIDVNKTSASKECIVCHCWYFLNKGFKLQSSVCICFHYVLMVSMNLKDVDILNMHSAVTAVLLIELINVMP